jgi:hypothetical protein
LSRFSSIGAALELLVEPFDVESNWDEILRRARDDRATTSRPRWSPPSRRLTFALAAAAVAILAATAFATGLAGRFSAWINGTPGKPAPAAEQRGFSARNSVSLAAFPAGTKLRLLLRKEVSGTSFDLLGFRNGDAYCLRLVRTKLPGAPGSNQCLRADELQGHVALVADDAWFRVGDPEISITGIYGFASDDVRAVRVTRQRGVTTVGVTNNVFLSLRGQRSGTIKNHPLPDPVLAVAAQLQGGSLRNIPYVVTGSAGQSGILQGGKRPTVPSYFAPKRPGSIPGAPKTVTAPISNPRIGWLARREQRGAPLPPQRFVTLTFGRVIQPDPDDPVRVGVAIGPARGMTRGHPVRGDWTCLIEFRALTRSGGVGCRPDLFADGPISLGSWMESPITHFNGLVADGIVRVQAFLASGRSVPAALRDNLFAVAVPQAELPGEIVGYNARGQVAGIAPLQGNAVAKPCPPAEFTTPTSQLPAPRAWEQLDLAALTVGGQTILGKTPEQVQTILGRPAVIRGRAQQTNGVAIPEYRYGGTMPSTLGLSIGFIKRGEQIVANSLYFQSPSLVDARLGHILRLQPAKLQELLRPSYGNRYRLYLGYGSNQLSCTGTFRDRSSSAGFNFGLNPYRPSRPFLEIKGNAGG